MLRNEENMMLYFDEEDYIISVMNRMNFVDTVIHIIKTAVISIIRLIIM